MMTRSVQGIMSNLINLSKSYLFVSPQAINNASNSDEALEAILIQLRLLKYLRVIER